MRWCFVHLSLKEGFDTPQKMTYTKNHIWLVVFHQPVWKIRARQIGSWTLRIGLKTSKRSELPPPSSSLGIDYMDVSENSGLSPQNHRLQNRVCHYKPSILGETPLFLEDTHINSSKKSFRVSYWAQAPIHTSKLIGLLWNSHHSWAFDHLEPMLTQTSVSSVTT